MDPLGDMAYHPDKEESIPTTILSSVGALISALGGAEARLRHVHPAADNRAAVLTANLAEGQTYEGDEHVKAAQEATMVRRNRWHPLLVLVH